MLLYHAVAACPEDADQVERSLFVDPDAFERQMAELAGQGYRTLRLDDYAAARHGGPSPTKSFLLTFDDGYAHVDLAVTPVLRRHGFSAVMFACWSHLGAHNTWDHDHPSLARLEIASQEQLVEMSAGPWEVASHSLRHIDLRAIEGQQRQTELREARLRLSRLIKKPVVDLAYPYGFNNPDIRADARRAGYRMAFAATDTGSADPLNLSRRPISGIDSMAAFRIKTSERSNGLYRIRGLAPGWARSAARTLLGAGPR